MSSRDRESATDVCRRGAPGGVRGQLLRFILHRSLLTRVRGTLLAALAATGLWRLLASQTRAAACRSFASRAGCREAVMGVRTGPLLDAPPRAAARGLRRTF